MVMAAELEEAPYYTEARIRYWLANWPLALSLAESWATSAHHLNHEREEDESRTRGCQPAPGGGRHNKRSHFDQLRGADVVADIERAHARLRYGSLEWTLIDYQMRFGPLGMQELRSMIGRDMNAITESYRSAVKQMADWLEG